MGLSDRAERGKNINLKIITFLTLHIQGSYCPTLVVLVFRGFVGEWNLVLILRAFLRLVL